MATGGFAQKGKRGRSQTAFRPDALVTLKGEGDFGKNKGRYKTPIQRTREEIAKFLDESNFNNDALKRQFISEAGRIETVTVMNMPLLAVSFMYLSDYPDADDFSSEALEPYLKLVMNKFITKAKPTDDVADVKRRYSQRLLSYVLKILAMRQGKGVATQLLEEPVITLGNKGGENGDDE